MPEDILVADESFSFRYQGADYGFVKGVTRVRKGHPILAGREHLFVPITPHFEHSAPVEKKAEKQEQAPEAKVEKKPEFEAATAAPNEVRGK